VKRIELLHLPGILTVRVVNTGNASTGLLTLALGGVNADAFTLSASTLENLAAGAETEIMLVPAADLRAGSYTVILTVSGEGLTPVTAEITYMRTATGLETPDIRPLRAWTNGSALTVSGLTPGQPWSIYFMTGATVYRGIASAVEANITLPVRGVYVIQSGNMAIKIAY
jgi:hypothetical protein